MFKLRGAISLIPWAVSLWGGLPAEDARGHLTVELTREAPVWGKLSLGGGVGFAAYGRTPGVGLPVFGRVELGEWDLVLGGGVWLFDQEVPVDGSRRRIFSGSLEAGRRVGPVRLAVIFYHLSNADTGEVNPGYNGLGGKVGW